MLEVSRTDIEKSSIMDFESTERFIKLPIDSYLELLGITPNTSLRNKLRCIQTCCILSLRVNLFV